MARNTYSILKSDATLVDKSTGCYSYSLSLTITRKTTNLSTRQIVFSLSSGKLLTACQRHAKL